MIESKNSKLHGFFTEMYEDVRSIRTRLKSTTPVMSFETYDPKKAFITGGNLLAPTIDEMTRLKGILLSTKENSYEIIYYEDKKGELFIAKIDEGVRRVMARYCLNEKEYQGVIEIQELKKIFCSMSFLDVVIR